MKVVGNESKDGIIALTSSGAITDGKPVVINYDGTCSQVSATGQTASKLSSTAITTTDQAEDTATAYDPISQKLIVAYKDDGDSDKGKVRIGTYNHATRNYTFSTPVIFFNNTIGTHSHNNETINIVFSKDRQGLHNRVVIIFEGNDGSWKLRAVVGTIVDNTIVFGDEAIIYSSSSVDFISSTYYAAPQNTADSTYQAYGGGGVILTAFKSNVDSKGYVAILVISGNFIRTLGATNAYSFANSVEGVRIVYSPTDDRAWIYYASGGDVKCKIAQVYISSDSLFFNMHFSNEFTIDANTSTNVMNAAYIPSIRRTVVLFRHSDHRGKLRISSLNENSEDIQSGTVSLNTSASIQFADNSVAMNGKNVRIVYDSLQEIVAIVHSPTSQSQPLQVIPLTFTGGDNVTIGTSVDIDISSEVPVSIAASYNSDANNLAIAYTESGFASDDNSFIVAFQIAGSNLSPYNFVGFANGTYASGQKVLINSSGTIVNQEGHTLSQPFGYRPGRTVYVLKDGTIRKFPDNVKAIVGTSVSTNEILVKG